MISQKQVGEIVPISPQNAQWNVIEEYNKNHTDKPIQSKAAEAFNVSDAYAWVLEKCYDAYFDIKLSFEEAIQNEKRIVPPICGSIELCSIQRNSNISIVA